MRQAFAWHAIAFPFSETGSLAGSAIRYLGDPSRLDLLREIVQVPEEIRRATTKRQSDYLAGRIAARHALERLTGRAIPSPARLPSGAPRWPAGVVGSISHGEGVAVAVAAGAAIHPAVGVDVQGILKPEQFRTLRSRILAEHASTPAGWKDEVFLTLGFSAKESLFKALSADVAAPFGFDCAHLTGVSPTARLFELRLTKTLARQWAAGRNFAGRYHVTDQWLMTLIAT